jgi:LacI family transcriptional regulator
VPKAPGRRETTLADIAAVTGLSQAAISLALRGKPGVSEATRARVGETARGLGYKPISSYRRTNKALTVTLLIRTFDDNAPEANRFYGPLMAGIEECCRRRRARLMLSIMPVDERNAPLEIPPGVIDSSSDGLIVVGAHLTAATRQLMEGAPPVMLVDAYTDDGFFDCVEIDNVAGSRAAVGHLVGHGHREIAILGTDPQAFPSILQRRLGYAQAMTDAGLTARFIDAPYYQPDVAAGAAIEYLRANPGVTAVFCANDLVAVAFIQAAREAGLTVPDQVSVIGFDDIDLASFITPALTTMAVDKAGMGRLAAALLLHRLEFDGESVSSTLIRPRLIERQTVRTVATVSPQPAGTR